MAIRGSLKEASLPDVIQLLAVGQKSGCLSIADRRNFGSIYFDQGKICYATVVNRRDRLGDILVKRGKITQDQLNEVLELQERQRDRKLGELLVEQGVISRSDLEANMRLQIEESVYFLFTWGQGSFNFESDVRPESQDFLVSINPESLLLEGARRVDEWSLIEKKIPSFDLVVSLDRERLGSSDVELTEEQQLLMPLIDGVRDIQQLVDESGLVEFDVGKALYGLMTAGFLHRHGASEGKVEVPDARVDEHRNLGVAFYKTGMLDEATRELRRVVELKPDYGGVHFYLGLAALRQARWSDAVDSFKSAAETMGGNPAVLHNLAYSLEQTGQLEEADAAYREAASRSRNDPRILTGWGVLALRRGDYEVAEGRLERAREVSGERDLPALWYWARGLAASARDEFSEAERWLRAGLKLHPPSSALRNNLAVLLELSGDLQEAEELLRAALADEPSLPQLSKNLGDILYRSRSYDEAWDHYQRAAKLNPDLGDDLYFKLGNIAYKRHDREQAAELWNKTIELNPGHGLARTNLETMSALA